MTKDFNTIINHAGNRIEGMDKGIPKVAPIVMSAAYVFENIDNMNASFSHQVPDHYYGREGNGTNDCANEILVALEGGAGAQVFATGMAAITMTILSLVKTGDHIIMSSVIFGGTFSMMIDRLRDQFGVDVSIVDFAHEDIEQFFTPRTKVVFMETVSNPNIQTVDIRKVADTTHSHGAKLVVDNTFATPIVCRPLDFGADIVVYSATKFMNGHSDIVAGAVIAKDIDDIKEISHIGHTIGPTMSPFDAFLFVRGLRTLDLRMHRHCENAMKLAEYFEQHPKVKAVFYPGLKSDPYHEIANKQFNPGLYGGMLTIDLGSYETVMATMDKFKYVKLVPSLGCLTTTFSDTRTSHGAMSGEMRQKYNIIDSGMRISVGLENPDDIIADFEQALLRV